MKTNTASKKLFNLYQHALEEIDFLSHVLIGDQESSDKSTELLTLEAAYASACFSRAVRKAEAEKPLGAKSKDLRHYLAQSLKLMGGSGEERFKKFLIEYFAVLNLRCAADQMFERIKQQIEKGVFQDTKNEETFEDEILDYFLFFDRFACLSHPKDAPLGFAKKELKSLKSDIDSFFTQLKPVFNAFAEMLSTYRTNVLIPNDPAYVYWYSLSQVPVEDFIVAYEHAFAAVASPEKVAFLALVASYPEQLKNAITALDLETKIDHLVSRIGRWATDLLQNVKSQLETPLDSDLALAPTYGAKKKGRTSRQKKISDDSLSLLRSHHSEDFKKALARVERDTTLSECERKELAAFACVLFGDRATLKNMLKEQPTKKKKR